MPEAKKRLNYIDVMRAFTMLLVVKQHVDSFALTGYYVPLHKVLYAVRMPMFFFISGFIGYKALEFWNADNYKSRLAKKAFVQLVPATIFFLLSALAFGIDPVAVFLQNGYEKYWFTAVLLGMFCIYYTTSFVARRWRWGSGVVDAVLLCVSLSMWLVYARCDLHHFHHQVWDMLMADRLCHFFVFFVTGTLCRKHGTTFHRLLSHRVFMVAVVAAFAGCIVLMFGTWLPARAPQLLNYGIQTLTVSILGILVVYRCFYALRHVLDNGSRVSRALAFAGRRTLDVYLIHYFFMPGMAPYLPGLHVMDSTWANALTSVSLSVAIYCACLCVSRLIRFSPTLAHWLLGANKP